MAIAAPAQLLSTIDARMDEVYWGWFSLGADGLVTACGDERVSAPERVGPAPPSPAASYGCGSGWNYRERMPQHAFAAIDSAILPRAAAVARLAVPRWHAGELSSAEQALPVYLRDDVAWAKPH
jgi:tRNA threonylcarbamoyladenosine biosynthesis protein TsaB